MSVFEFRHETKFLLQNVYNRTIILKKICLIMNFLLLTVIMNHTKYTHNMLWV